MSRVKLDNIDRKILRELRDNGRITNVELSKRVGISAPPCLRRVRALEEAGLIRGYHADLEPTELGYNVTVFAQIGLTSQAEPDLVAFESLINSWAEVDRSCSVTLGVSRKTIVHTCSAGLPHR